MSFNFQTNFWYPICMMVIWFAVWTVFNFAVNCISSRSRGRAVDSVSDVITIWKAVAVFSLLIARRKEVSLRFCCKRSVKSHKISRNNALTSKQLADVKQEDSARRGVKTEKSLTPSEEIRCLYLLQIKGEN